MAVPMHLPPRAVQAYPTGPWVCATCRYAVVFTPNGNVRHASGYGKWAATQD